MFQTKLDDNEFYSFRFTHETIGNLCEKEKRPKKIKSIDRHLFIAHPKTPVQSGILKIKT